MATHKSAIKRHRQSLDRRARNKPRKTRLKTALKALQATIESKDRELILKTLSQTTAIIDKTATKGLIKKNTASRKISRLTKQVNTALQAQG